MKIFFRKAHSANIFILLLCILVSAISIMHVLVRHTFVPQGYVDLFIGHFHIDYLTYLKWIAVGVRGDIFAGLYQGTDSIIALHQWPHIALGMLGGILGLTPWTIYWLAVFVLSAVLLMPIFYTIDELVGEGRLYLKMCAFLISVFSSPFYIFQKVQNVWQITSFDYWYGPGVFSRRFEVIPYHLLSYIVAVVIILLIARYLSGVHNASFTTSAKRIVSILLLFLLLATFSPFSVITLFTVFMIVQLIYVRGTHKMRALYFAILTMTIVLSASLFIKNLYGSVFLFQNVSAWERQYYQSIDLVFMILNIGPIALFIPFGIKLYFKKISPLSLVLFIYVCVSYIFFISPVARFLGTHNLRFLTAINYIPLSVLFVYGTGVVISFFKLNKKIWTIGIVGIMLLYFSLFNGTLLYRRALNTDPSLPLTNISFISPGVLEGFSYIANNNSKKAVLTHPNEFFGQVVPIFLPNKVVIGEPLSTYDYWRKATVASELYLGRLNDEAAKDFLKKNNVGYVVITSIDKVPRETLKKAAYLRIVFENDEIALFETQNN